MMSGDPNKSFEKIHDELRETFPDLQFGCAKRGQVRFSDTPDCTLDRNAMLLRSRMAPETEPRLTLKVRSSDILLVSTTPVALVDGASSEFEDDYGIGPEGNPVSDPSRSLSYDGAIPETLSDLAAPLAELDAVILGPLTGKLQPGPLIDTVVHASKPYPLHPHAEVVIETSLWEAHEGGTPLAGDVSLTLDAPFDYEPLVSAREMLMNLSKGLGSPRVFPQKSIKRVSRGIPVGSDVM